MATALEAELTELAIECNARGDRAKAYLYCADLSIRKPAGAYPCQPLGS